MFWAYIITLARAALYAYKTREELVQLEAQYANSPEQCILNKFYDEIDPIERRPVQVETEDLEFHYVDHRNVSHRLIQRNFAWFFFLMSPREHFKQRVNNFCIIYHVRVNFVLSYLWKQSFLFAKFNFESHSTGVIIEKILPNLFT